MIQHSISNKFPHMTLTKQNQTNRTQTKEITDMKQKVTNVVKDQRNTCITGYHSSVMKKL